MDRRTTAALFSSERASAYVQAALALSLVILISVAASIQAAPHFRLYTNWLGGGMARAGYYFPHDEFYDASMRDVMVEIAQARQSGAKSQAKVHCLLLTMPERANRSDLGLRFAF